MFRRDATDALARFPVPALILAGSKDLLTRAEASHTMAERMPQADLEVIEGAGHMGFLEKSDLYNAAIARIAQAAGSDAKLTAGDDTIRLEPVPAAARESPPVVRP